MRPWEPRQVWFRALSGTEAATPVAAAVLAEYRFDHAGEVPARGDEQARLNLWLIQGQPPGNGQEYELIVRRFEHVPLLAAARTDRLNLKLCGIPGSTYLRHLRRRHFRVHFALVSRHSGAAR